MSVGYAKVLNLAGGYVVQQPLSPRLQSFNAANEIQGVLGELTLFAVADLVARTFRLPIATQPGQTCAVKSIHNATSGVMNVLASFDYDNGYQQILVAGQASFPLNSFSLATYSGESAEFVSGISSSNPNQLSWFLTNYNAGGKSTDIPPYRWVWPNAAARIAQTTGPGDIGALGFQTDIAREFKLLALAGGAPNRWGKEPANDVEIWRTTEALNNETNKANEGWNHSQAGGTPTAVAPSATNATTRLVRIEYPTGAVAGNSANSFVTLGFGPPVSGGWRYLFEFALVQLASATHKWFVGISGTTLAGDVNFSLSANLFGIGRHAGQANVQAYCNNSGGASTQTDLGANFPANTAPVAYQLELYIPPDFAQVAWNVRNKHNNFEASGTFSGVFLFNPSAQMHWQTYITTGTTAAQCNMAFGSVKGGQLSY